VKTSLKEALSTKIIFQMAAGRQLNETTKDWLERLISIGASDAQINGVTAILQQESKGIFPKVNSKFF